MKTTLKTLVAVATLLVTAFISVSGFAATPAVIQNQEMAAGKQTAIAEYVAKQFNISFEDAAGYIPIHLEMMRAKNEAEADNSSLKQERAKVLAETAQAHLFMIVVVSQGKALMEKLEQGEIGAEIPSDLMLEIRTWMPLAIQATVDSTTAASNRAIYIVNTAMANPACKKETLDLPSCLDRADNAMTVVEESMEIMDRLTTNTKDIMSLIFAKRMTY